MAAINNWPGFQSSGTDGAFPVEWSGVSAPDGDGGYWVEAPPGSRYIKKTLSNGAVQYSTPYRKNKNDGRDDDWGTPGFHVISQRVTYSQFTDGGSTAGTKVLNEGIPEGAWVLRAKVRNVTGFTGNVSAALIIGDGSDADRYCTASTVDVFTTIDALDGGAPSGTQIHTDAKSVTLTVTSGTDWGLVTAGAMTVDILYWL
jgi:hypothetical protein